MHYKALFMTLLGGAMALPLSTHAQSVEFIFLERNANWHQVSSSGMVEFPYEPPYSFEVGFDLNDGSFSQLNFHKGSQSYDMTEDLAYGEGYEAENALAANWPAGTYRFSGTGSSVGNFSFDFSVGPYSPIAPKHITNFDALQTFDPSKAVVIEWEAFTDYADEGVLAVEIGYPMSNGDYVYAFWESDDLRDDGFPGLPRNSTSIAIPAGTLTGSDLGLYDVWVHFLSIEMIDAETPFPDATFVNTTGASTYMQIAVGEPIPSPELYLGLWEIVDGWADTENWLSWIYTRDHPWVFQPALDRTLYVAESSVQRDNGGWVYVPANTPHLHDASETSDLYLGWWEIVDSWADTENWLGWIYTRDHPWIFHPGFDRYMYLAEASAQAGNGGWLYIPAN